MGLGFGTCLREPCVSHHSHLLWQALKILWEEVADFNRRSDILKVPVDHIRYVIYVAMSTSRHVGSTGR